MPLLQSHTTTPLLQSYTTTPLLHIYQVIYHQSARDTLSRC
jgi:hypothetical protein